MNEGKKSLIKSTYFRSNLIITQKTENFEMTKMMPFYKKIFIELTHVSRIDSCDGLVLNLEVLGLNPSFSCSKRSTFKCCPKDATHMAKNNQD